MMEKLKLRYFELKKRIIGLWHKTPKKVLSRTGFGLFVISGIFLLAAIVANTGPGQMLFFPKLAIENLVLKVDVTQPDAAAENKLRILRDRAKFYRDYSNSGSCVLFVAAESELEQQMLDTLSISEQLPTAQADKLLSGAYVLLRELPKTEECITNFDPELTADVMGALATRNLPTSLPNEVTALQDEVRDQMQQLLGREAESSHLNQERLNNINGLVLLIEKNLDDQERNRYLSAIEARKAVESIEELIDNEVAAPEDWRLEILLVCQVNPEAESCNLTELEGKWNSIQFSAASSGWANSLVNGRILFEEVINELFPVAENN